MDVEYAIALAEARNLPPNPDYIQNYRVVLANPDIDVDILVKSDTRFHAIDTAFDTISYILFGKFDSVNRDVFTVVITELTEEEANTMVENAK